MTWILKKTHYLWSAHKDTSAINLKTDLVIQLLVQAHLLRLQLLSLCLRDGWGATSCQAHKASCHGEASRAGGSTLLRLLSFQGNCLHIHLLLCRHCVAWTQEWDWSVLLSGLDTRQLHLRLLHPKDRGERENVLFGFWTKLVHWLGRIYGGVTVPLCKLIHLSLFTSCKWYPVFTMAAWCLPSPIPLGNSVGMVWLKWLTKFFSSTDQSSTTCILECSVLKIYSLATKLHKAQWQSVCLFSMLNVQFNVLQI